MSNESNESLTPAAEVEYSSKQATVCSKCQTTLEIGMYPFCKGNPADHGQTFSKTAAFPFTVNHVTGQPMVIESLGHLRSVERQYGVCFSAFSKSNERDLDPIPGVPRFRGDDEDVRRDTRRR